MLQLTASGGIAHGIRSAQHGAELRSCCLQNSNDSFQPQKQVLQSSTERFVFHDRLSEASLPCLLCCTDQKDFQIKAVLQIEFLCNEKSFSMNLQATYKKVEKKNRMFSFQRKTRRYSKNLYIILGVILKRLSIGR